MDYMEIPRLKLRRAIKHFIEFECAANKYLSGNPFGTDVETYTEDGKKCLRLLFKVYREPPKELAIIVGDCVHNLRSSLDNVVWGLGQVYPATDVRARPERLSFPMCFSAEKYAEKLQHSDWLAINYFPKPARNLINNLQPYQDSLSAHRIRMLHELWNADKHRVPNLVGGAAGGVSQSFNLQQPAGLMAGIYIQDGKQFGYGVLPEGGVSADAKAEIINVQLLFQENGPASGFIVRGLLNELIKIMQQEVIDKIEPLFQ